MEHIKFIIGFNYTHQHMNIHILFKKSKIYIETLKTLLHVSITRSSSGSLLCSLLKLQFKTFSELLHYVNFGAVAACRVFVCESYAFRMSLVMGVGRMPYSVRLYGTRCTPTARLILNSVWLTHNTQDRLPQHQS